MPLVQSFNSGTITVHGKKCPQERKTARHATRIECADFVHHGEALMRNVNIFALLIPVEILFSLLFPLAKLFKFK